ncbi:efflux RND transporter permease subunit, partial [Xanthomonas citri pv. citri]
LTLRFVARGERPLKQEIEQQLRLAMEDLPGVRVKIGLGGSNDKYVLALASEDPQALADTARAVERDLRTIPGVGNIGSSASLVRPEIVVRPDFARAADLGVTSSAIAETLRVATVGDYDQNLPKLNLP